MLIRRVRFVAVVMGGEGVCVWRGERERRRKKSGRKEKHCKFLRVLNKKVDLLTCAGCKSVP